MVDSLFRYAFISKDIIKLFIRDSKYKRKAILSILETIGLKFFNEIEKFSH